MGGGGLGGGKGGSGGAGGVAGAGGGLGARAAKHRMCVSAKRSMSTRMMWAGSYFR